MVSTLKHGQGRVVHLSVSPAASDSTMLWYENVLFYPEGLIYMEVGLEDNFDIIYYTGGLKEKT